MGRTYKFMLGFVLILLGAVIYLEASQPNPVNWTPTYSIKDKIPLGTYVFFHNLEGVSPRMEKVNKPPFEFLKDSTINGSYLFIHSDISFNPTETKRLFNWVKRGNTLLLAAQYFDTSFLDTLNLKTAYKLNGYGKKSLPKFKLINPKLKNQKVFTYNRDSRLSFFKKIDTTSHIVLGLGRLKTDSVDKRLNKPEVNFVKVPMGKGKILLHSAPRVFSNYFILDQDNYQYIENLLGYIDVNQPVYYDTYYGPKLTVYTSVLYVLMNNRYLKWAYYFVLIGAILFIIFEGRRKQKAIKVVQPPRNMSYAYTRTIAGLFLDKKDHTAIAHKKITQFLEFIRTELRTDVESVNESLINRLKELTQNSKEDIRALFEKIQVLQKDQNISKDELLTLNEMINNFKKNR